MKKLLCSLFLFLSFCCFSQNGKYRNISFSDYLDSVYFNSNALRTLLNKKDASVIDKKAAAAKFSPSLNFNLLNAFQFGKSIDPSTNTFVDISLVALRPQLIGDFPIYSFGKKTSFLQEKKNEVISVEKEITIELQKLFSIAASEYFSLYLLEKQKAMLSSFYMISKKLQNHIEIGYRNGKYSKLLFLQIISRCKNDSLLFLDIESKISLQRNKMQANFLATDSFSIMPYLDSALIEVIYDPTKFIAHKYDFNDSYLDPISKYFDTRILIADLRIKQAKSAKLPEFRAVFSASSIFTGFVQQKRIKNWFDDFGLQLGANFNQIAGISLFVPIMNHKSLDYSLRKAIIEKKNLTENYIFSRNQFIRDYSISLESCQIAEKYYKELREIARLQNDIVELAEEGVLLGKGTFVDFITYDNERRTLLYKTEAAYIDLIYKSLILSNMLNSSENFRIKK